MRLIDADACIDDIRNNNQQAWEALAYAPTIDAVEVVRCSDCEYRGDEIACPIEGNDLHHISDYDYCSWGELKGGDTE